MEPEHFVRRA